MPNMPPHQEPQAIAMSATQPKSNEFLTILAWFCAGMVLSSAMLTLIH